MPRIAVAIFVVVAVSVSIGINIARYPAVFEMAGSTHESLVSDDTTDVSGAKETEGTVAVNSMPSLPDEDLAKWNPPMVNRVKPTVTEAVPHVASNNVYGEPESETASTNEEVPEVETPSSELNHYEVEPYRPYMSQPVEEERGQRTEDRGQRTEEVKQEESAAVSKPEAIDRDSTYENHTDDKNNSAYGNSASYETSDYNRYTPENDRDAYQPSDHSELYESGRQEPSGDAATWQEQPSGVSNDSPVMSHASTSVNEMQSSGHWPATVAEVFHYKQEPKDTSGTLSFYDRAPGDGYEQQTAIHEVSSTKSISTASLPSHHDALKELKKPLPRNNSNGIRIEKVEWKATLPMVAVHDHQPMNEDLPCSQIKRLPSIEGTEVLPGSLPSPETMDYPVAKQQ